MGALDDAIRQHLDLRRKHGATDDEIAEQEAEALGPVRREVPEAEDEELSASPPEAAVAAADPPLDVGPLEDLAEADEVPATEILQGEPGLLDEEKTPVLDEPALGPEEPALSYEAENPPQQTPPVEEPPLAAEEPPGTVAPAAPYDDELEADSLSDEAEPVEPVAEIPGEDEFVEKEDDPAEVEALPHEDLPPLEEPGPGETPVDEEETLEHEFLDDEDEQAPENGSPPPVARLDEDDDVLEETPEFLQETPEHDRLWFEQKPPRDFDLDD